MKFTGDKKRIEKELTKLLFDNGELDLELYKQDLENNVEDIIQGLTDDDEDFAIVITEEKGRYAMLLAHRNGKFSINDEARAELKKLLAKRYESNMWFFLPYIVEVLAINTYWIAGIKLG